MSLTDRKVCERGERRGRERRERERRERERRGRERRERGEVCTPIYMKNFKRREREMRERRYIHEIGTRDI